MICNKCGADNDDASRFCRECGHKLQSGQTDQPDQSETEGGGPRGLFEFLDRPPSGGGMGRYFEAWAYALLLICAGFALIRLDAVWALYLLVPLAAYGLRLRGL